jgi:outer membrane protein TolC
MKSKIVFLILFFPGIIQGQEILNDYIRYGLENNLALKQKQSSYLKSIESLKEARGMFYPSISFNARYTLSEGGRVIDFPVGDLLNPVYATLNNLTSSQLFPDVLNQQIRFLRPTEQETKIRLAQPVFNPDIYYNSEIKKELSLFEQTDVRQYRRELVAEIKKAYYNVSMTVGIVNMLGDTRKLLVENVRVNRKLVENNKLTIDKVYRSESELSKLDQELQDAGKDRKIACAYFNFLLNRPLDDSIIAQEPLVFPAISDITGNLSLKALETREEIMKLENYSNISDLQKKMNESGILPDMFLVVDYGFQGEKYQINKNQDYVQASAILTWNLFSGFQNKAKIRQAILQKEIIDDQLDEIRKQIEMQVLSTMNELLTAEKAIIAAEARLKNSREGFRIVKRKYEEGQAGLLEFLDARTTLTQAEENLIISKFRYLSGYAELERVIAINETE